MQKRWCFRSVTPGDLERRDALAGALDYSEAACLLLVQRGIESAASAEEFLHPALERLHDPFLMTDMDKAVERLNKALVGNEKILIYGDYDVDGTTAVALVYRYLQGFTGALEYYIPDRYAEGYGVSKRGIDYASEQGVGLIIALDCGIKATEAISYAKGKGIDFIVCDHHMPDATLPEAVAILDAKRADSTYPYAHLSGCGVGFKFMQAFAQSNGLPFSGLESLLELTAVSIASDIVPLTGENRILAHFGLQQLNSHPSVGFRGIIEVCGLAGKRIQTEDIVYRIGPRLNASGRMMSGREAVELLLSKDSEIARTKSANINQYNEERRELDKKMTGEANAIIKQVGDMDKDKAIVVYHPDWHKGVIGIVASRLTERYYRPTIVLTNSGGVITGSARSIPGFDIYKAIEDCRDLLDNFGGHTYAAGMSLKEENLQAFIERFRQLAAESVTPDKLIPQIDIDAVIELKDITRRFMLELKQMSPFGPDNPKPVFCSKGVKDYGTSKLVGKNSEHLKLVLIDDTTRHPVHAIAFGMHRHNEIIQSQQPFSICYTIEENTYKGNTMIQLLIQDIKADADGGLS